MTHARIRRLKTSAEKQKVRLQCAYEKRHVAIVYPKRLRASANKYVYSIFFFLNIVCNLPLDFKKLS